MKFFIKIIIIFLPYIAFSQPQEENISVSYTDEVLKVTYNPLCLKDSIEYTVNLIDDITYEIIFKNKNGVIKTIRFSSEKDTNFTFLVSETLPVLRKPIVYIYSPQKQDLTLKIEFKGKLKIFYPNYNEKWTLQVGPDGIITDQRDNKQHRYLYWEGIIDRQYSIQNFSEGFIIEGNQTAFFLDSILYVAGFNDFEKNDFISYWLPYLSKYNKVFIHFYTNEKCNEISEYTCNKKIDTYVRLYMFFAPIENEISILPQKIYSKKRIGLTLVEWGGMQINTSNTK